MRKMLTAVLFAIAAPATAQPSPPPPPLACDADPLFRQSDFILGSWDVSRNGAKSAEVRMERALNGCAILESWIKPGSASGHGIGLFTYSRVLKALTYAWASDAGAATFFTGALTRPGEIHYKTERTNPDGGRRLRDWSLVLLPDGRIRELSVASDDGGASWTTEYDLLWTKRSS